MEQYHLKKLYSMILHRSILFLLLLSLFHKRKDMLCREKILITVSLFGFYLMIFYFTQRSQRSRESKDFFKILISLFHYLLPAHFFKINSCMLP